MYPNCYALSNLINPKTREAAHLVIAGTFNFPASNQIHATKSHTEIFQHTAKIISKALDAARLEEENCTQ